MRQLIKPNSKLQGTDTNLLSRHLERKTGRGFRVKYNPRTEAPLELDFCLEDRRAVTGYYFKKYPVGSEFELFEVEYVTHGKGLKYFDPLVGTAGAAAYVPFEHTQFLNDRSDTIPRAKEFEILEELQNEPEVVPANFFVFDQFGITT